MSFSSELKEELSQINNFKKKQEITCELVGYLISRNTSIIKNNVRFATESDYNINRFSKILKNLDINHKIDFDGKSFIIIFKVKDIIEDVKVIDNEIHVNGINQLNEYEKRAIIRGAFLGAGSINNPKRTYHLEINLSNKDNLDFIDKLLIESGINTKTIEQDNKYFIYLKDGEEIFTILALMGANKSVLKYEDVRVQKEMNAKVNRIVNCQTANLNKTINASVEQIDAIRKLQATGQFNKLNDNLKEIALLRLKNPDMSLIDLGKLLKSPLGKSGVNYRLKKIIEIANEL